VHCTKLWKSQGHQRRYSDFSGRLRRWLPKVLDYLIELNTTNNCVFIRGNHDELLLHWLRDSKDNLMWYKHGEATVLAYEKVNSVTKQLHVDFYFR
jgi:hypothetical protein